MNYHSFFYVSRDRKVGIVADGPLNSKELRHVVRMIEMDIETFEKEEADAEGLRPAINPGGPASKVLDATGRCATTG